MRQRYDTARTERALCNWIRRYVKLLRMQSREDPADGTRKVDAFSTDLLVQGQVSPATQNQAFNALILLYEQALERKWLRCVPLFGGKRAW